MPLEDVVTLGVGGAGEESSLSEDTSSSSQESAISSLGLVSLAGLLLFNVRLESLELTSSFLEVGAIGWVGERLISLQGQDAMWTLGGGGMVCRSDAGVRE